LGYVIGYEYTGSVTAAYNNGLFSDAYANLGPLGCILMPAIIVVFLKFMQKCASGLQKSMLIAPAVALMMNLISSSFFTLLLTHGELFMCVLLYILPRDHKKLSLKI